MYVCIYIYVCVWIYGDHTGICKEQGLGFRDVTPNSGESEEDMEDEMETEFALRLLRI